MAVLQKMSQYDPCLVEDDKELLISSVALLFLSFIMKWHLQCYVCVYFVTFVGLHNLHEYFPKLKFNSYLKQNLLCFTDR